MNEMNNSPNCERASDLIAFLYSEASESETRDFELHMKECAGCREEVASFGVVRESITAWRDEALSGFVSTPLAATARTKSAIAALRQFFDLSPLWLKAAAGFAVVAFCVLAVAAFMNVNGTKRDDTAENSNAVYTQADVDRIVKDTLAKQQSSKPPEFVRAGVTIEHSRKPTRVKTQTAVAKSRRPLTRAEREQLAADLRLLSTDDELRLNLLGDRMNNSREK